MRKHRYDEAALRHAWRTAPAAASGGIFWRGVRRIYARDTGCAPGVLAFQVAANRRGMRARITGRSRSTSRWAGGGSQP